MPYFELQHENPVFPPAHFADPEGLLAVGGQMSEALLLKAYQSGIFYWHHPMKHVRWWSPDPRIVLYTDTVDLEQAARQSPWTTTGNTAPEALLRLCQERHNREGAMGPSWLSERMYRIFISLQAKGRLFTREVWDGDVLIGGFFGVISGSICHGEYAVATREGADTLAIASAAGQLRKMGVTLMDMHKETARDAGLEYDTLSRLEFVGRCRMAAVSDAAN